MDAIVFAADKKIRHRGVQNLLDAIIITNFEYLETSMKMSMLNASKSACYGKKTYTFPPFKFWQV